MSRQRSEFSLCTRNDAGSVSVKLQAMRNVTFDTIFFAVATLLETVLHSPHTRHGLVLPELHTQTLAPEPVLQPGGAHPSRVGFTSRSLRGATLCGVLCFLAVRRHHIT